MTFPDTLALPTQGLSLWCFNIVIRTARARAVADPDGPDGRLRTILLIIDFGILSTVYLFVRDFSNYITIHDSRVDS